MRAATHQNLTLEIAEFERFMENLPLENFPLYSMHIMWFFYMNDHLRMKDSVHCNNSYVNVLQQRGWLDRFGYSQLKETS